MSFTPLVLTSTKPHEWTLQTTFCLKRAWHPSLRTRQAWIQLGLQMIVEEQSSCTIIIPEQTRTDLGTVPRLLWWFCSPVDIAMAAVIHDHMYDLIYNARHLHFHDRMRRRAEADNVFLLAMHLQHNPWKPRIWTAWLCVRMFGWLYTHELMSTFKYLKFFFI